MRRFGVSIPEDLAKALDDLAEKLGVSRSEIVREALRLYLAEHAHYTVKHRCCGMITVVTKGVKDLSAVEEFKDVVSTFSHIHVEDYCINSLVVYGDSDKIAELHRALLRVSENVRFIPLECKVFKL
jgi:CopG family nickel-responsive transcriptional regulator